MSKYFSFLRKKRNSSLHDDEGDVYARKRKSSTGKKSSSQSPKSSKSSTSSSHYTDNRQSVHSIDLNDEMQEISTAADPFYSDSDSVLDNASVGDISVEIDDKEKRRVGESGDDFVGEKAGGVKITRVDVDEDEGHVVDEDNDELIDDFMDEALEDLEEDEVIEAGAERPSETSEDDRITEASNSKPDNPDEVTELRTEEVPEAEAASSCEEIDVSISVTEEASDGELSSTIVEVEVEVSTECVDIEEGETLMSSGTEYSSNVFDVQSTPSTEEIVVECVNSCVDVVVNVNHAVMDGPAIDEISQVCISHTTPEEHFVVDEVDYADETKQMSEDTIISTEDGSKIDMNEKNAKVDGHEHLSVGNNVDAKCEDVSLPDISPKIETDSLSSNESKTVGETLVTEEQRLNKDGNLDCPDNVRKTVDEDMLVMSEEEILYKENIFKIQPDPLTDFDRAVEGKDKVAEEIEPSMPCDFDPKVDENLTSDAKDDNVNVVEVDKSNDESELSKSNFTNSHDGCEGIEHFQYLDRVKSDSDHVQLVSSVESLNASQVSEISEQPNITLEAKEQKKGRDEGNSLLHTHTSEMLSPYSSTLPSEIDEEEFDSAKEDFSNGEEDTSTYLKNNLVIENVSGSEVMNDGKSFDPCLVTETKNDDITVVENSLGTSKTEHHGVQVDNRPENVEQDSVPIISDSCNSSTSPTCTTQDEGSSVTLSNGDLHTLGPKNSTEFKSKLEEHSENCERGEVTDLYDVNRSYSTQTSTDSVKSGCSTSETSDSSQKRRISIAGRRSSTSELGGFIYNKRRSSTTEIVASLAGILAESPGKQTVTEENFLFAMVNADHLEAEARLAQRRAARAEARELRLRELEKQQQQEQQENNEEEEQYAANSHSPAENRIVNSGMRTGSPYHAKGPATKTPSTPRARASVPVNNISRRSSEDSIPDELLNSSARELKSNLLELEEKFRKAMVTNAQLDNEKATLTYEVENLKDKYTDLEEAHIQLTKEHKKKCSENEQLRKYSNKLKEEIKLVRRILQERDELIQEYGLVLIGEENGEESYDDYEDEERKDDTINALSPRNIGVKKALLSQEASELLAKGAAKGSLDVRLKKYAEDKHNLEDEVRRLKLLLEEELSRQRKENGLDYEKQKETSKSLNECKFKIQKAEAEVSTLQANVARLESLVTRYKASTEELEKSEEDLKAEKRRLQRELRESQNRLEELELTTAHMQKRFDKLKTARSTLLKDLSQDQT